MRTRSSPRRDGARRRQVVAVGLTGTALLGASLAAPPGGRRFYGLTFATAATLTLGGLATTPPSVEPRDERMVVPAATGVAAFGVFYGCALIARRIPVLRKAITNLMRYADQGRTPAVLLTALANGAAEEVFFRGAVYRAAPCKPVAVSTGAYILTTAATRNPALVLAAAVMGTLFGLQRRATGGIRASLIAHLTWSTLMLHFMPPLFLDDHAHPTA
ncbi:CPBP family intramembrane glutamic endopeptidase [Nocardia sp. AG03]|uniref:CPBP family intramembrane glutamic endopeptidase n=1 Tax=Nocardia sp. AG03 TaxID=3025312 RepID=UPI0024182CA7|nr:CPBP family intramembrane glutamic endopeptidase [Nocardia sp. AG03]